MATLTVGAGREEVGLLTRLQSAHRHQLCLYPQPPPRPQVRELFDFVVDPAVTEVNLDATLDALMALASRRDAGGGVEWGVCVRVHVLNWQLSMRPHPSHPPISTPTHAAQPAHQPER